MILHPGTGCHRIGRASALGSLQSGQDEKCDVVVGLVAADEFGHDRRCYRLGALGGHGAAEPVETGVDVCVATLDEPVGVEADGRAHGEFEMGDMAGKCGVDTKQQVVG